MNRVMKCVNGVMLASLLSFNANAANPELWKCSSKNMAEKTHLFLVYREQDFMLFSYSGVLLDLGSLVWINVEGESMLRGSVTLPSGKRPIFLSTLNKEDKTVLLQIFAADGSDRADLFICD